MAVNQRDLLVGDLYHFHVNLFAARPASHFDICWEEAARRLECLDRMLFELDGSFVVAGQDPHGQRWQVDGHLFDFDARLQRVELQGTCPANRFDDLLRCVGWPTQLVAFQLVREGVTVDEEEFRQRAGAAGGV